MKKIDHRLIVRYITSGVAAFVVEYGLFSVLYSATHRLLFANTLSFCGGLVVSFIAQKFWTFYDKDTAYHHKPTHQASLFITLAIVNLAISTVAIELIKATGLSALVSKVCVMVIVAGWNFVIFKYGIFRKRAG